MRWKLSNVDAKLTERLERRHQKRAATRDAYRVAKQQKMAARRALEWIGTSKAQLVFRYEISDLLNLLRY